MIICQKERFLYPGMTSLSRFVLIGKTADPNVAVECFMTVHTVIILGDISRQRNMSERIHTPEDYARQAAETKLLKKLKIYCKECNTMMSTGLQEGNRYYYCGNNTGHEDNLDRYVWVRMPEYLDITDS